MNNNKKLPKVIEGLFKSLNESDTRATEKKAKEILDEEKKMISGQGFNSSGTALGTMIKNEKKNGRKTKLFKLTGVGTVTQVFFRPIVMPSIQIECEKWWFSKSLREKEDIKSKRITGNGVRDQILKRTLDLGSKETHSQAGLSMEEMSAALISASKDEVIKYWPLFMLFLMMFFIYVVNIPLQSGLLALVGFVFCLLILWQCRFIKVKRSMGLKYFCPFAVLFIQSAYISEMAEKKDMRRGKNIGLETAKER